MAKILIVDDSGLARRTLRRILEAEGHEILEAEDGIMALERYFLDKPDLVLLDLVMTGMYGIEVLTKLREMDAQARIIVASADIQSSSHELARATGAAAYIAKPFVPDKVIQTVNDVLAGGQHATDRTAE
jgi:two-component system chemotaxis response regulator CheY